MLVERLAVGGGPSHLKNLMWLNETFRFFNFTRRHDDVDLCPIQPKNYVARWQKKGNRVHTLLENKKVALTLVVNKESSSVTKCYESSAQTIFKKKTLREGSVCICLAWPFILLKSKRPNFEPGEVETMPFQPGCPSWVPHSIKTWSMRIEFPGEDISSAEVYSRVISNGYTRFASCKALALAPPRPGHARTAAACVLVSSSRHDNGVLQGPLYSTVCREKNSPPRRAHGIARRACCREFYRGRVSI
jgi:hypothetical protein